MAKDVRREQLELLKFEKKLEGLAAFAAAGSAAVMAASTKINTDATTAAYGEVRAALVHLADVTSQAHAVLHARALEVGAKVLEATGGGHPKPTSSEVVRSILGIG